jgi:hypothetical protein
VETPRKFITAKLSIRKPGSSSVLIIIQLIDRFHSRDRWPQWGGETVRNI